MRPTRLPAKVHAPSTPVDEPGGWDKPDFDGSGWSPADIYTKAQVSPKGGYDAIDWSDQAQLIWGPDLEQSNTVLCRLLVE